MAFESLTDFLHSLTEETGIPGVGCIIYQNHEEIYRHCSGWADRENRIPMTTDRLMNLYSTSKVITCAAALSLMEKGKFLLPELLCDYLPEFTDMNVVHSRPDGETELLPAKNKIRIIDLFTMSAGLTYNLGTENVRQAIEATNGLCPTREIVKAIAKDPLSFEPGEHWQYSLCHDVLAALVEVVSGKSFGEYVREAIFEPCGMIHSGYAFNDEIAGKMAAQYRYNYETRTAERIEKTNYLRPGPAYESGGAGVISCIEDYILFADAMCNDGVAKTGKRILSPRTIDLMRTNCLTDGRMAEYDWPQTDGYGYGLGVRTMVDRAVGGCPGPLGEFGWGGAAGTYVLIDPENRLAVFYGQHMLNNLEPYVHPRIRNLVYREI